MKSLKLVKCDDWEALYKNDECIAQDHELSHEEIDEYYGDVEDLIEYVVSEKFDDYLSKYGRFPDTFPECLEIDSNMEID